MIISRAPILIWDLLYRSLKLAVAGLCFALACLVSMATWYYVVGEREVGIKGTGVNVVVDHDDTPVVDVQPVEVQPDEHECPTVQQTVKTATEWYSPGKITPTSKVRQHALQIIPCTCSFCTNML